MIFQLNDYDNESRGLIEIITKKPIEEVEASLLEIGQYCLEEHPENFWDMVETLLMLEEGIISANRVFIETINL